MQLVSAAFGHNGILPAKHARQSVSGGRNVFPSFSRSGVPPGTESFALTLIDLHPVAGDRVLRISVYVQNVVLGLLNGPQC